MSKVWRVVVLVMLLVAGSVVITVVTYYMEFRSASVTALTQL